MTEIKQVSSNDFDTLLNINGLNYKDIYSDITLVDSRIQRFVQSKINGVTSGANLEFELSVGNSLCYGPGSYLEFDIKADASATFCDAGATSSNFLSLTAGSALNIIESVLIKTFGKEIDRSDAHNVLMSKLIYYNHSRNWISHHMGSAMGMRMGVAAADAPNIGTATQKFIIPLRFISGIFGNYEQLIPSGVLNGMELTLKLASATSALSYTAAHTGGAVASYTVSNARIFLDLYNLKDSAQLSLTKDASKSKVGLVFPFKAWSHNRSTTADSNLSVNVSRPYSHVLNCLTIVRASSIIEGETVDSFQSFQYGNNFPTYRYLLGSRSFPEEKLSSPVESYFQSQSCFNNLRNAVANDVSLMSFNSGLCIHAQSFQLHDFLLDYSGVASNKGGILMYLEWSRAGNTTALTFDSFTSFKRVLSVFANGRIEVSD